MRLYENHIELFLFYVSARITLEEPLIGFTGQDPAVWWWRWSKDKWKVCPKDLGIYSSWNEQTFRCGLAWKGKITSHGQMYTYCIEPFSDLGNLPWHEACLLCCWLNGWWQEELVVALPDNDLIHNAICLLDIYHCSRSGTTQYQTHWNLLNSVFMVPLS